MYDSWDSHPQQRINYSAQNVTCAEVEKLCITTLFFPSPEKSKAFLFAIPYPCKAHPCISMLLVASPLLFLNFTPQRVFTAPPPQLPPLSNTSLSDFFNGIYYSLLVCLPLYLVKRTMLSINIHSKSEYIHIYLHSHLKYLVKPLLSSNTYSQYLLCTCYGVDRYSVKSFA